MEKYGSEEMESLGPERRRDKRFEEENKVVIECKNYQDPDKMNSVLAFTKDISIGGAMILTDIFFLFHNSSGKKIVEVLAYDQYGINITELCTFTFIGEFEQVSENTVEILGDRLTVKVSLSGVEITGDILEVSCRKPFLSEKAIFALAASMLVIVIVVFIVVRKFVFIPSNLDQDEDAFSFPEE